MINLDCGDGNPYLTIALAGAAISSPMDDQYNIRPFTKVATNNVYQEANDFSAISGSDATKYIKLVGMLSLVNGAGYASPYNSYDKGPGIQIKYTETGSYYMLRQNAYMRIENFSMYRYADGADAGGVRVEEQGRLQDCFMWIRSRYNSVYAIVAYNVSAYVANTCLYFVMSGTGGDYIKSVKLYSNSGTKTLEMGHCTFGAYYGIGLDTYVDQIYAQATGGNAAIINSYNNLNLRVQENYSRSYRKAGSGGTETINNLNCISSDSYANKFGGSGNIIDQDYISDVIVRHLKYNPSTTDLIYPQPLLSASVCYKAGCALSNMSAIMQAMCEKTIGGYDRNSINPDIGCAKVSTDLIFPDAEIPVITTSGGNTQNKFVDIEGTCQTQECVIKIYESGGYVGQGIHSPPGQTTWKVENVGISLGDNVITATSKIPGGDESAESSSITLTGIVPVVPAITTSPQEAATHIDIAGTCQTEECYIRIHIGGVDTDQGVLSPAGETTFTAEGIKISPGSNLVAASAENDFGESTLSSTVDITGIGVFAYEGVPTIKLKVGSKIMQEKDLMPGYRVVKFDLTKGDDSFLRLSLLDSEGAPLDLTYATSVNLKVKENISDTSYVINTTMAIDDVAGGKVYYAIGKTIFTSIGSFVGEISITWTSGNITTAERRIEINVKPEL